MWTLNVTILVYYCQIKYQCQKNSFFCFMPYQCYLKSFFEPYLSTHDWTSQLTFCQTKAFVDTLIKAAMLYWNGTTTIATFLMPHAPKSSTSLPSLKIPLFYLKPIFFLMSKIQNNAFFFNIATTQFDCITICI